MKRYYMSKIIGDGETPNTAFRSKISQIIDSKKAQTPSYKANFVSTIKMDNSVVPSVPVNDWCLVLVDSADHTPFANDPDIDALPDFKLDSKVSSMHTATKGSMISAMVRRNIDTSAMSSADGFRDVVRQIGQKSGGDAFDENHFDVSEAI